jgi:nitroreductase
MNAPSAMNAKPYEYVVVTDKQILKKLWGIKEHSYMVGESAFSVAMLINSDSWTYGRVDAWLSVENMLIEAISYGIWSCCVWLGLDWAQAVKEILNVPENKDALVLIAFWYADEEKEANDNYYEEKVHWEMY